MAKPPELYSLRAEEALIGAALTDPGGFHTEVMPADFHDEELAGVWQVALELKTAGQEIGLVSVGAELDRRGRSVPHARLVRCVAGYTNSWDSGAAARIVRDFARRRQALAAVERAAVAIHGKNGNWSAETANLAAQLAALVAPRPTRESPKTTWTVAELLATAFPDPEWAVPGILPIGLTILAGRPKVGKSWLALQIAHAIGSGGMVLDRAVKPGRVLFLALEDRSPRRLKERLQKQRAPAGADISFSQVWRPFPRGGLEDLCQAIGREGYRLTIVDTLTRALGMADQSDPALMTGILGDLQGFAQEREIAILLIDHHRKPGGSAPDLIDDVWLSSAKTAVVDAILGLYRERGRPGASLKISGRDVAEQELALSWDAVTCCWQLEGSVQEVTVRGRKSDVVEVMRAQETATMTLTEIAQHTGIDRGNLSRVLADLIHERVVKRLPKQGRDVPYQLIDSAGALPRGAIAGTNMTNIQTSEDRES